MERRRSDPQPCTTLSITANPSDARSLGFKTQTANTNLAVSYAAMADTGCQSCLAGLDLLQKLQIKRSHLIPVTMQMKAANNKGINIIGAFPLRLSGKSPSGSVLTTRQLVYFTDSTAALQWDLLCCLI